MKWAFALAAMVIAPAAQAATLTFDDLSTFAGVGSYNGLSFSNFTVLDSKYGKSGYVNGIVSGNKIACGCAEDAAQKYSIVRGTGFVLNDGYFTSAWYDGATLTAEGFVNNALTFSKSAVLNTSGPTLLTFDWSGLDQVRFSISGGTRPANLTGAGNYFALDNLRINAAAAVPEPATWAMMMLGFGVIGYALRRRTVLRFV